MTARRSITLNATAIARFWAKVNKAGPAARPELGPCWIWTAGHLPKGYGQFKVRSYHQALAHRVSWVIANGAIPAGLDVCHRCDTPPCVRPDHLFLATNAGNVQDMTTKGRQWLQAHPERAARGERAPGVKLTATQVQEIRQRSAAESGASLAREYGVTKEAIYAIVKGHTWKEIS